LKKEKRKKLIKLIKFEGENKKTWVGTGISFIWEGTASIFHIHPYISTETKTPRPFGGEKYSFRA
jgi:hypothetical protein